MSLVPVALYLYRVASRRRQNVRLHARPPFPKWFIPARSSIQRARLQEAQPQTSVWYCYFAVLLIALCSLPPWAVWMISPPRLSWCCNVVLTNFTREEVNEARGAHTCTRPCALGENKRQKKHEIPRHPRHTTQSTEARRPRPPRVGAR